MFIRILLLALLTLWGTSLLAQDRDFDAGWYDPAQTYVKIGVVADGVYQITGADLANLGFDLAHIQPQTLLLLEHGQPIPLALSNQNTTLQPDDKLTFVGKRNTGVDEAWAYNDNPTWQSSTRFSLFSDTTYYWLTWNSTAGRFYTDQTGTLPAGTPPLSTYRAIIHQENESTYYEGDSDDARNPLYTRGEGYYTSLFSHGAEIVSKTFTAALADAVAGSDSIDVQVKLSSQTITRHRFTLNLEHLQNGSATLVTQDEADWTGYAFATLSGKSALNQLPNPNTLTVIVRSHNEFAASPNRTYFDWMRVTYTREMNFATPTFSFTAPASGPQNLTFQHTASAAPILYNATDGQRFSWPMNADVYTFADAPSANAEYWAVTPDQYMQPVALRRDQASDWANPNQALDYVVITVPQLHTSAEALAQYHANSKGFNTAVINVWDLFDQFDYGRPTPVAIRRFVEVSKTWARAPRFLVFWGDALDSDRRRPIQDWEVITFGRSASDAWFGMNAAGPDDWSESLAIGRVPVRTHEQGLLFVEKLQAYESAPRTDWQKRMMFISGGESASEQGLLQSHQDRWRIQSEGPPSGLQTHHFSKRATTPLDASLQDSISTALREGTAWLNYFGHSAPQTWEIIVDPPEDFDNAGRLPVVISLGCNTGAFTGGVFEVKDLPALGEALLVGSLNGSIAHWGASHKGSIFHSAAMADDVFDVIFRDTVRVLGEAFTEAKRRFSLKYTDPVSVKHLLQYSLLGDPATQMAMPSQPDFHLAPRHVALNPLAPTPADSVLTVQVNLQNVGLYPADSVLLQLTHRPPEGPLRQFVQKIPPFALQYRTTFTVPIAASFVGQNHFDITIDPTNFIAEHTEQDNTITQDITIFADGLQLISPPPLGLIGTQTPVLQVSPAAPAPFAYAIIFELDTISTFDSPQYQTFTTNSTTALAEWPITTPLSTNQTYFWRARLDDPTQPENWVQAAFTIQPNAAGWHQNATTFAENPTADLVRWTGTDWAFDPYRVQVFWSSERGSGSFKGALNINGEKYQFQGRGFGMIILDGNTGAIKRHESMATYGDGRDTPESALQELQEMQDLLRPGDHFFIRTRHLRNLSGSPVITPEVKARFQALGSTAMDTLTYSHLWLMQGRFGFPEATREWVEPPTGANASNEISQHADLFFTHGTGSVISPVIGPAQTWHRVDWVADLAHPDQDISVEILAPERDSVLLPATTRPLDLAALNAQQFPFIRLRTVFHDAAQIGTPQLTSTSVLFDEVPELLLDPHRSTIEVDTVREGQPISVVMHIANLSGSEAQNVLINYWITSASNETSLLATDTLSTITPHLSTTHEHLLKTRGFAGENRLRITLTQPNAQERLTFNNTWTTPFFVEPDDVPPMFEVRINGQMLPHNPTPIEGLQDPTLPFVNAQPVIEITMDDRALDLPLADTHVVDLSLNGRRLAFANADLLFEPVQGEDTNRARVVYTPDFSGQDSTYTLAVRARDASNNAAEPYQVHFRVQTSVQIEHMYPYPNPMHQATTFAFELRGETPSQVTDFRMRIYTLAGRLVREFNFVEQPMLLDAGALQIGWNKFRWTGEDAEGDLLPTGIYLYKIFLKSEDGALSVNNASGIEKIAIIR